MSLEDPQWTLQADSAEESAPHAFRVLLPQRLIVALSGSWPNELFSVELTVRPQQHAAWTLSCRLALNALATQAAPGARTRVEVPVFCRSERVAVGLATIAVAVDAGSSPLMSEVILDRKPSKLEVNILQVKTLLPSDIIGASKTVALRVWLSGEPRDNAAKSPPFVVTAGEQQHGVTLSASLTSQDAMTDFLCVAIETVNTSERHAMLAIAQCALPSTNCTHEAWTDLHLVVNDDNEMETVCGAVFLSLQCSPVHVSESAPSSELTAVSLLAETTARAAKIDTKIVRGSVEIELREASASDDKGRDAFVQLEISHSRWSTRSAAVRVASDGSAVWHETFRVPIVWSTTDRVVPSLSCDVISVCEEERSKLVKKAKQLPRIAVSAVGASDRRRGTTVIDLPVFFAHANEWATVAPRLKMQSNEQVSPQASSAASELQLKIRIRFVHDNLSAPRDEDSALASSRDVHGHLAFSCFKATGAFLQRIQSATQQTELRLGVIDTREQENNVLASKSIKGLAQTDAATGATSRWEDESLVWTLHEAQCKASPLLWLRMQDASSGSVVGEVCVPVFASMLHSRHVVSFSLPIVSDRRTAESDSHDNLTPARRPTKASLAGTRWRQGTLTFEMQFIDGVQSQSRQRRLHLLVHELDQWRGTAIPSLCRMVTFRVTLNDSSSSKELWSSKSAAPVQVPTHDDHFSIEQSIDLSPATAAMDDDATKNVLVIQLHDVQGIVLSHAMVHLRGGWKKLLQREKNAWHNLYGTESSGQRNDESSLRAGATVGRIRVSIIERDPVFSGDNSNEPTVCTEDVVSWLLCEIVTAMQTSSSLVDAEAWISVCLDGSKAVKTLRSTAREKDGTIVWQWRDPCLMIPVPKSRVSPTALELVFSARVNGTEVHSTAAMLSVENGASVSREEWLTLVSPMPNDPFPIHVSVRLQSFAADPGTLVTRVDQALWLRSLTALSVPINAVLLRLTLRAGQQPALSSAVSAIQPFGIASAPSDPLYRLNNTVVQLPVHVRSALCRPPELLLQLMSTSAVLGELCLGETTVALPSLVHDVRSLAESTRWLTLLAPHEGTSVTPTATMKVSFLWRQDVAIGDRMATRDTTPSTNATSSLFSDYGEWQRASVAVFTIWKKLFYTLDEDRSGRIDLHEFRMLFAEHADVFSRTSDGALLFRILMNTDAVNTAVTPAALSQLFQEMDVNHDKTVEWSEYIAFLQRRLDLVAPSPPIASSTIANPTSIEPPRPSDLIAVPPSAPAAAPIERERRRKRREDPHASASAASAPIEQRKVASVRRPEHISDDSITESLQTKVVSLETALQLERQRSARLREELAALPTRALSTAARPRESACPGRSDPRFPTLSG
ncbi:hypothetical protein PINS_up002158 [Pythium insidiosum]|nr:hypothetical protein PINS_up002158 [Pythium insidiosum]